MHHCLFRVNSRYGVYIVCMQVVKSFKLEASVPYPWLDSFIYVDSFKKYQFNISELMTRDVLSTQMGQDKEGWSGSFGLSKGPNQLYKGLPLLPIKMLAFLGIFLSPHKNQLEDGLGQGWQLARVGPSNDPRVENSTKSFFSLNESFKFF